MIFQRKKQIKEKPLFFLIFLLVFFSAVQVSANDDQKDFFSDDYEEEDIACENLPTTFQKYNQDIQLQQHSLKFTLRETAKFLKELKGSGEVSTEALSKMINDLEEAQLLSQDNEMVLYSRGSNIAHSLDECLKNNP